MKTPHEETHFMQRKDFKVNGRFSSKFGVKHLVMLI